MERQEFLQGLEEALTGEISVRQLQSNLQYYRDYISEEISRGRPEQEVMEELGDPRLIARTIVDAAVAEEESQGYYRTESDPSSRYNYREAAEEQERRTEYGSGTAEYRESAAEYRDDSGNRYAYREETGSGRRFMLSGWKATLAIAAVIVLLVGVISAVFHLAFRILFSPVFWVLLIGFMIWRAWKG